MKAFGKLSEKIDLGLFDTIDFGNKNATVENVRFRLDPSLILTGAYAGFERPGVSSQGTFLSAVKTIGQTFIFAQHEATRDTETGYGHRINAGAGYFKNGLGWDFEYLEISPEFNPRIGFAPERNLRGFFLNVNTDKVFTHGPLSEAGYSLLASEYNTFQHEQYRRERDVNFFTTLRNGLNFSLDADYQRFLGSDDVVYTPSVSYPSGNPYNHIALNYSFGHITGIQYRNFFVSGAYRPLNRLQFTFSAQAVKYDRNSTQTILGVNYDLTRDTSVSGRFVQRDHDTNAYIALHKAGYAGLEYYLIIGDPNADRFRTSVILKLVMPFQLKLGRT